MTSQLRNIPRLFDRGNGARDGRGGAAWATKKPICSASACSTKAGRLGSPMSLASWTAKALPLCTRSIWKYSARHWKIPSTAKFCSAPNGAWWTAIRFPLSRGLKTGFGSSGFAAPISYTICSPFAKKRTSGFWYLAAPQSGMNWLCWTSKNATQISMSLATPRSSPVP